MASGTQGACAIVQARTQTLQELYMRDLEAAARSPGPGTVREVQQQQALAALATPDLLAISQPAPVSLAAPPVLCRRSSLPA